MGIEPNLQCEGEGGILNINNHIKHMDTLLPWLLFDDYYNFWNELISTQSVHNATAEFLFWFDENFEVTKLKLTKLDYSLLKRGMTFVRSNPLYSSREKFLGAVKKASVDCGNPPYDWNIV